MHFKLSRPPSSPEEELVKGFANASDNICLQLYHLKLSCDQALVSVLEAPSGQCHLVKKFKVVPTGLINNINEIFYHKVAPLGL